MCIGFVCIGLVNIGYNSEGHLPAAGSTLCEHPWDRGASGAKANESLLQFPTTVHQESKLPSAWRHELWTSAGSASLDALSAAWEGP